MYRPPGTRPTTRRAEASKLFLQSKGVNALGFAGQSISQLLHCLVQAATTEIKGMLQ